MTTDSSHSVHVSVMREEAVTALKAASGGTFLDCTLGGGGHSAAILEANTDNRVIGVDRDVRAVTRSQHLTSTFGERFKVVHAQFSQIGDLASQGPFDGVLADLGMSTYQLREGRGFSFVDEGPLDMRMNESEGETAADFLQSSSDRDLYLALVRGGVGKTAKATVKAIKRACPITTPRQLAEVISSAHLGKKGESRSHPATVVFQALRMHINREAEEINGLLDSVPAMVRDGARFAVITFHSIEDQLVTGRFREWENAGSFPASWRGPRTAKKIGRLVTRKPILPSDEEVQRNPASRSARLRVFEFNSEGDRR